MENKVKISRIDIEGYKSFGKKQEIALGQVNILIGANGVGKSNFLSLFELMSNLMIPDLQSYVSKQGGADTFFYKGLKTTKKICLRFDFADDYGFGYRLCLEPALPRDIDITKEEYLRDGKATSGLGVYRPNQAHKESVIPNKDIRYGEINKVPKIFISSKVYHFVDTSDFAEIRGLVYENDHVVLDSDGRNLAACLKHLKKNYKQYYDRIINRIRQIMPQFGDFVFKYKEAELHNINLDWMEQGSSQVFRSDQIADGALRFMALASLLLQPPELLPPIIIIDEPELGLHPEAIMDFMGMVKIASQHSQIILATQSPYLVNCVEIDQIIIADRENNSTVLKRLEADKYKEWLRDYSLAELWEKNLIGGRP